MLGIYPRKSPLPQGCSGEQCSPLHWKKALYPAAKCFV